MSLRRYEPFIKRGLLQPRKCQAIGTIAEFKLVRNEVVTALALF